MLLRAYFLKQDRALDNTKPAALQNNQFGEWQYEENRI
jgi:hypothetical protein